MKTSTNSMRCTETTAAFSGGKLQPAYQPQVYSNYLGRYVDVGNFVFSTKELALSCADKFLKS